MSGIHTWPHPLRTDRCGRFVGWPGREALHGPHVNCTSPSPPLVTRWRFWILTRAVAFYTDWVKKLCRLGRVNMATPQTYWRKWRVGWFQGIMVPPKGGTAFSCELQQFIKLKQSSASVHGWNGSCSCHAIQPLFHRPIVNLSAWQRLQAFGMFNSFVSNRSGMVKQWFIHFDDLNSSSLWRTPNNAKVNVTKSNERVGQVCYHRDAMFIDSDFLLVRPIATAGFQVHPPFDWL